MRAMPITAALLLLFLSCECMAQPEPCGLSKITDTTPAFYPPIGKSARVGGTVILLVTFKVTGEVERIETVSGPKILESSARLYVQGWRANEFSGPRTCPVVIHYRLLPEGDHNTSTAVRSDLQHVTISAPPPPPLDSSTHSASLIQLPKTIELLDHPFDSNSIQQLYYVIRLDSVTVIYRP
jgi:hypothetical protein